MHWTFLLFLLMKFIDVQNIPFSLMYHTQNMYLNLYFWETYRHFISTVTIGVFMENENIKVKFENEHNPKSDFELLRFEKLIKGKKEDHFMFNQHIVEFYMLIFITGGNGKHMLDFKGYMCEKGTLLVLRKDQFHKFYKESNLKGYLIFFKEEFIFRYLEYSKSQKTLQIFNEALESPKSQLKETEYKEILSTFNELEKEYKTVSDNFSLDIVRSLLHILIVRLHRIKSKKNTTSIQRKYLNDFLELQKLVTSNATNIIRVIDYAKEMGISSKTLNNITKSIVNKSAKEFIDEIRVLKIKRLLINTEQSIKEISYNSGFNDDTNFYNFFKRHTSTTPDKFRSEFI